MRRRALLGLAATVGAGGCVGWPGAGTGSDRASPVGGAIHLDRVDAQATVLAGTGFDVRAVDGGAFLRVRLVLTDGSGTAVERFDPYERLREGLTIRLDGRRHGDGVLDRASDGPGQVLAVAVPSGAYDRGEVVVDAAPLGRVSVPVPRAVLDTLADPPAFEVTRFSVSQPVEQQFVETTIGVEDVGGSDGRFLAALGPVTGVPPLVVSLPVRRREAVTAVRELALYLPPGGPVAVRLQWGTGSAERTAPLLGGPRDASGRDRDRSRAGDAMTQTAL